MSRQISVKQITIWMGSFFLVAVVLAVVFKSVDDGSKTVSTGNSLFNNLPPVSVEDWVVGTSTPKVVLIEYSDFECPACASYFPIVENLVREYVDQLQFVYRHFPLPQHSQAKSAAYASEAAGLQGKFFEMYRMIFESQRDWSGRRDASDTFEIYASRLGLDMDKYRTDVNSREIKNKIDLAYTQSVALGLNSTPTFFLNGEIISSPRGYEEFRALIEAQLNDNE